MSIYKKVNLLLYVVVCTIFPNAGGMFHYPGVISDPVVNERTDFSIEKEMLDIEFYEDGLDLKCRFTAKYYLRRDSSTQEFVAGTFYGIRNENIRIYAGSKRIDTTFDALDQNYYDSFFFEDRMYQSDFEQMDIDEKSKKNFIYYYDTLHENIMTITGEGLLKYSQTWGLGLISPSIQTRHPFLNRNSGKFTAYFKYITDPINTWKRVGYIDVTMKFPAKYVVTIYSENHKIWTNKIMPDSLRTIDLKHPLVSHTFKLQKKHKEYISNSGELDSTEEKFPSYIDIVIENQKQTFYPGGLKVGFGKLSHSNVLIMRYGWECALEKKYVDTHLSLDYDTDFKNYNTLSLSAYVMSPWFLMAFWIPNTGIGAGITYNLEIKKPGLRLLHESNFGFFGFSGSYDYYPAKRIWILTLLGLITL